MIPNTRVLIRNIFVDKHSTQDRGALAHLKRMIPSGWKERKGCSVMSTIRSVFSERSRKLGCFLASSRYACSHTHTPCVVSLSLRPDRQTLAWTTPTQPTETRGTEVQTHRLVATRLAHHPRGRTLHVLTTHGTDQQRLCHTPALRAQPPSLPSATPAL